MYIKRVIIDGFRSYRKSEVSDLSPRHNVIVGRNGSGKSNFFLAIQFVLSEEYGHLRTEQRDGLIHEGAGERMTNARVEIVFDNVDRRFITTDADEVSVTRQVGPKKDQYLIDGKISTRADVVSLMESAGFSRSNPYYIVKQGKINELATSSDVHRLNILREVAGTRIYDERREQSLTILRETDGRIAKVETLLSYIGERLKVLEEQTEELREYQKWDKVKRSVEYVICDKEEDDTRKSLERFTEEREEISANVNKVTDELLVVKDRSLVVSKDLLKLEDHFKGIVDEKEALLVERTENIQKKTELDLLIKDLRADLEKERIERNKAEDELAKLKLDISAKEEELRDITPKFAEAVEDEAKLNTDIKISEQKCKDLYAKQGYKQQYKTVAARDKALKDEIRFYEQQVSDVQEQITVMEENLKEEEQEEIVVRQEIAETDLEMKEITVKMSKKNQQIGESRRRLEELIAHQQEENRSENSIRNNLEATKAEVLRVEQDMRRYTSKSVRNGVDSVKKVLETFRGTNEKGAYDRLLSGYHGIVMDLFRCDPIYNRAVEVVASNKLFYHVVDNDKIALKILKEMNSQQLMGEANFYPLNRIIAKAKKVTNDPDARTLMDCLQFDDKYEVVFRSIFGGTAIVRDLLAGNKLAKSEGFDCVTLEGDQVSRRGVMTGGYIDAKSSRLDLVSKIRALSEQIKDMERALGEAVQRNNERIVDVEKSRMQIEGFERDIAALRSSHETAMEKRRCLTERDLQLTKSKEPKVEQIMLLKNRIREMCANKETLEKQIGSPLLSQLSDEESSLLEKLQAEVKEKKSRLKEVTDRRAAIESVKLRLENQLETNLLRKRERLESKAQDTVVDVKQSKLQSEMAELDHVNRRLSAIITRLGDLEKHLAEYEETRERLDREAEGYQEQIKDLEIQITEFSKQADFLCSKQSTLQLKRDGLVKKIRELGCVPVEVVKYEKYSLKQLEKKLDESLKKLVKYEKINKKALDQFTQASTQREDLVKRLDEHKENQKAINDLIAALDHRKYEAISLIFKRVSKNFETVFEKLVPGGRGRLIMKTRDEDSTPSTDSSLPQVETFVGVGMQVSFNGSAETRELQQLSGGQKSLVALALIFAIQKCDPAPFYLFDEIDAALDPQYRGAIAGMIHELSENAQFITTTFRPELLATADKYLGVRFRNKVSYIDEVSKEQAFDFVEDDQTRG